jgi:hypothetical protein
MALFPGDIRVPERLQIGRTKREDPIRRRVPAPKRVSPATVTGPATRTPYHPPRPAPKPKPSPAASAGKSTWDQAKALARIGRTAPDVPPRAVGGVAGGVFGAGPAAGPVPAPAPVAAPVAPVPVPGPAALAPASPAPVDPYAGYPPEVAALLRANDQQSSAQSEALRSYFNNQAGAAEQFATQFGQTATGLANIASIPSPAVSGLVPGPTAALGTQLGGLGQKMLGAEGFNLTNAAALTPGFLRQAGIEAQTGLTGQQSENRSAIIENYVDEQAALAKIQAEQMGLDERTANEFASRERMAAADRAVKSTNDVYDFISSLGTNLTREQIAQISANAGVQREQIQGQTSRDVAGIGANSRESIAATRVAEPPATRGGVVVRSKKKPNYPGYNWSEVTPGTWQGVAKPKPGAAAGTAAGTKPLTAPQRLSLTKDFRDNVWNDQVSGGVALPNTGWSSKAADDPRGATIAVMDWLGSVRDTLPGPNGLKAALRLLPAGARAIAQHWIAGQPDKGASWWEG